MPIHYPDILDQATPPRPFSYGPREAMLYALGVGYGSDPLNRDELPFVYEKALKIVPTAVCVLSGGGPGDILFPNGAPVPAGHRPSSFSYPDMLHGEEKIELHHPLPTSGDFVAVDRVAAAYDKGKDKGALVVRKTQWHSAAGDHIATVTTSLFCRKEGGFGGPTEGAPKPHPTPARAPDLSIDFATRPDQALIYRLSGDLNPLHADPDWARESGFERPILHGLCTFGFACRAVLATMADNDPDRILSHQARMSAPVYPGDVISFDLWRDGKDIAFEAHVRARGVTVLRNGLTVLR